MDALQRIEKMIQNKYFWTKEKETQTNKSTQG